MKLRLLIITLIFSSLKLTAQLSFFDPVVDTLKLDEVIVTGTKSVSSRYFVPLSLSRVGPEEINASTSNNAFQAISELSSGVFLTQRGIGGYGVANGSAGKLNIRGFNSGDNQILVLIDGTPQFMGLMGHPLPDTYTLNDIEHMEVLRGPASMLYGTNAVGGVVNIITREQKESGGKGNLGLRYGMYNSLKANAGYGYKKGAFNTYVAINHEQTDNHRDSAGFNMQNAMLKLGYRINQNLKFDISSNVTNFTSADPGPEDGVAGDTADVLRARVSASLKNNFDVFAGGLSLHYNYGDHKITDGWNSIDEMWGLSLYESAQLFKGNELTLGYDYITYGGVGSTIVNTIRDEDGNIIPNGMGFPQIVISPYNNTWISQQEQAAYLATQQKLGSDFVLSGGVRYTMHKEFGNEWIPQIGLVYNFKPFESFNFVVSKGYRNPSIKELYFFPTANEGLMPEKLMNYEFIWRHLWLNNKAKTEVTIYNARGENLIIQEIQVPGQPPQYRNSGEFNNWGVELSSVYHQSDDLWFMLNYAYINMDKPLPTTPEHNINLSANYKLNAWHFNLSLQNISNLYATINNEVAIIEKNYSILNAKVAYDLNKRIGFDLHANNLFNSAYELNFAYPMPGINMHVGVKVKI